MNINEPKIQEIIKKYVFLNDKKIKMGLFENMIFDITPTEGCYLPKLLGVYEQPLQDILKTFPIHSYERMLNIGCAEGFYAIGFALKYKDLEVVAFDVNDRAKEAAKKLAEQNKFNINIQGLFDFETFSKYIDKKTIIFCDIESYEKFLLDPSKNLNILHYDFIVESHEFMDSNITNILKDRFEKTHNITFISDNKKRHFENLNFMETLSDNEISCCIEESRPGPTPWLIMTKK
jgi:hypothetical protein